MKKNFKFDIVSNPVEMNQKKQFIPDSKL